MADWSRRFIDAIALPGGRKLLTLKDAADITIALPKREHDLKPPPTAMKLGHCENQKRPLRSEAGQRPATGAVLIRTLGIVN
jgi:hypothetical protein